MKVAEIIKNLKAPPSYTDLGLAINAAIEVLAKLDYYSSVPVAGECDIGRNLDNFLEEIGIEI